MEKKSNNNTLEATFREVAKHHQKLMRWGLDKIFVDNQITSLLHDARRLLNTKEYDKAANILSEIKTELVTLEKQYPIKKIEMENNLLAKITQLESRIEKSTHAGHQKNTNEYFKVDIKQNKAQLHALEMSRIAVQNNDWLEAQQQIDYVANKLNVTQKNTPPLSVVNTATKPKDTSTIERLVAFTDNNSPTLRTPRTESRANTRKKATSITGHESDSSANKPVVIKATASTPSASTIDHSNFGPVAKLLLGIADNSANGKLVNVNDLLGSLQIIEQSGKNNVRIGFIATGKTIDTELSCFSKKSVVLSHTENLVGLFRIPVSRKLTVYMIGLPFGFDFNKLKHATGRFSALFINTNGASENDVAQLSHHLPELLHLNSKVYIKDLPNVQAIKKTASLNALDFLDSSQSASPFIENVAGKLNHFSSEK